MRWIVTTAIRWGLTIALLAVAWNHVHWSVALSLTLVFLGLEGQYFVMMAGFKQMAQAVELFRKHLEDTNE